MSGPVWDAVMQGDGNLVVYDPYAHPLWASATAGNVGTWVVVQDDGNVVVYDANNNPLWASNTVVPGQPAAPTATDRLMANQGLTPGQFIKSQDGRFTLIFQTDGNLVLYAPGGQALWAANTAGHVVWDAIMQGDGNLVVYDPYAHPLWATGTNGHAGAWLIVQNDGNLVIYDANNKPLWASNTVVLTGQPAAPTATDRLTANQGLTPGQSIKSQDGRFTLIFQTDGNLVLYAPGGQALWAANTAGHVVWDAIMQGDGNLVVYDPYAHPLWATGTNGHAGAWLIVQNDGNLVIYDANNKPLWASNTVVLTGQPAAPTATDRLTANQGLTPRQSIKSQDGRFTLIFQTDGNLVLYAPGAQVLWASGSSFYLELKEQPQQESNWCWSATTVSITIYYDPASRWTQCTLVNKAFNQTTCCQNGSSNNCNQPWYGDQALSITGHLNSATGGSLSLSAVMQQMRDSRPISIAIYWNGGGGHNPAIDGFDATDPTAPVIEIEDPIFGHSTQDFNSFPTTYQGGAKWGNSFLTK